MRIARSQGAGMLVLRAAVHLGRLPSERRAERTRKLIRSARRAVQADAEIPDTLEADALLVP